MQALAPPLLAHGSHLGLRPPHRPPPLAPPRRRRRLLHPPRRKGAALIDRSRRRCRGFRFDLDLGSRVRARGMSFELDSVVMDPGFNLVKVDALLVWFLIGSRFCFGVVVDLCSLRRSVLGFN